MKKKWKVMHEYLAVAHISQAELARRLGVHQGQLNHWMQGRRKPRVGGLKAIARETGISLERLARDL